MTPRQDPAITPPSSPEALLVHLRREGLPRLSELRAIARGDEDALQTLWIEAVEHLEGPEKGASSQGSLFQLEKGASSDSGSSTVYVDEGEKAVHEYLVRMLRNILKREKKRNSSRKKRESSYHFVTSTGENDWP